MAEGLARDYAARRGRRVETKSAGTLMLQDRAADPYAVAVCREIDVDLSQHRSQGVTDELIAWCDYALVMEYQHAATIRDRHPEVGEKLLLLGSFAGIMEVPDPIGGWKFQFRRSREQIKKCVEQFIDRIPPTPPVKP